MKEELNLDYKSFIKLYVAKPIYDFTISFSFRGRYYQFDRIPNSKNDDGSAMYYFIAYDSDWNSSYTTKKYNSINDIIQNEKIEGLSFEEVYNSPDSKIIDIS